MRRMTTNAAVLTVCAGSTFAGPLMPERVLPDATWIVHVDVESIVASNFGRTFLEGEIGHDIRADIGEEAMAELGIDPLKDIRGVTLFGHGADEEQAVVVVSASEAIDVPLSKLPMMVEGYSEIREGNRVVHSWNQDGEKMYIYAAPGKAAGERVVLFSGNIDELKRGMVRFEAPGGADVAPVLNNHRPRAGSFFYFSADEMVDLAAQYPDHSAILRYAQGITIDAGENENELRVDARVATAGADEANTMLQVVQGMMALGRMAASSEPDMAPLLKIADGCRASTDGASLLVSLTLDSATIAQVIQEVENHEHDEDRDAADDDENAEDEAIREDLKKLERIEKPAERKKAD